MNNFECKNHRLIDEVMACITDCLSLEPGIVSLDTRIGGVPEWDSLGQITIYIAVQKQFEVTIPLQSAGNIRSVKDWADAVEVLLKED